MAAHRLARGPPATLKWMVSPSKSWILPGVLIAAIALVAAAMIIASIRRPEPRAWTPTPSRPAEAGDTLVGPVVYTVDATTGEVQAKSQEILPLAGSYEPDAETQAIVDDAVWEFTIEPSPTIGRLSSATVEIPYPWVEGDAHEIVLVSRNGVTFDAEIEVAAETPSASGRWFLQLGLLGFYVGVIPVALGLATYPFLRRLGRRGMDFVLALTVGLLVFLAIDTLAEALETAADVAEAFHASILVWIVALATLGGLLAITGRRRTRGGGLTPLALATFIALGIGLHNLGEGLAIGSALARGAVGLGTFLVVGFTLHNITEGVGIAAPLLENEARPAHFAGLALLAGGPAILGTWIGGFVFDPLWAAVFLAVGAGAILQVVWEVGRLVVSPDRAPGGAWRGEVMAGAALGLAVMYATALLVPA
ncbi:MAG: metal transporter [Gemmatimonadetes bacterium]|nr:metal transporter [Gemmatimonadota bacterium]